MNKYEEAVNKAVSILCCQCCNMHIPCQEVKNCNIRPIMEIIGEWKKLEKAPAPNRGEGK